MDPKVWQVRVFSRPIAALVGTALLAGAIAATAQAAATVSTQSRDNVRPCPDDSADLCVYGPADFRAQGKDIRVLAEAADASVTVRGDKNDVSLEDGFIGALTVVGDGANVDGSDGNDRITTLGCDNLVKSRAGDDVVTGDDTGGSCAASAIVVRGGKGTDALESKSGELAILKGERDRDLILGGAGDDRVRGGEGVDDLRGRKGNDDIRGGRDGDLVCGSRGDDVLRGGGGDDFVCGERGHDSVRGNSDDDEVEGNQGRDRVLGGKDDDKLEGGKDDDFLDGGFGVDFCIGGMGDDLSRRCET